MPNAVLTTRSFGGGWVILTQVSAKNEIMQLCPPENNNFIHERSFAYRLARSTPAFDEQCPLFVDSTDPQ